MKLILKDGRTIVFDHDNGLSDIVAVGFPTLEAANTEIAKLTPRNLSRVSITTDAGDPVGEYADGLVLDGAEIVPNVGEDGETVTDYDLHLHMHEKTAVELLTERMTDAENQITEIQMVLAEEE